MKTHQRLGIAAMLNALLITVYVVAAIITGQLAVSVKVAMTVTSCFFAIGALLFLAD